MHSLGVIPARWGSSRLPGKPLALIAGQPMIHWTYRQALQARRLDRIIVATDDSRIAAYCADAGIPYAMTSAACPNHIHRVWEVSNAEAADYYVSINGDEPLIEPSCIDQILPRQAASGVYFGSAYRELRDPAEAIDPANVKIVLDGRGNCLYQSRMPIPYPKGSLLYTYKKAVGIECFNKDALDFFAGTPMGSLERIEDIDHLRFLEHGETIHYEKIDSRSLSVDTPQDLEKVQIIIQRREHGKHQGA